MKPNCCICDRPTNRVVRIGHKKHYMHAECQKAREARMKERVAK